jgi:hypothetical protein
MRHFKERERIKAIVAASIPKPDGQGSAMSR